MPVPSGPNVPPELQQYLGEVDQRLSQLEAPQGFTPAYLTTSAALSTATAAAFSNTWGFATDLATAVWSDGAHWRRADTGAVIV